LLWEICQIHQEGGNYKLAIKYYKISLKNSPNEKDVWENLGNAYASLRKEDDAINCFWKITEIDDKDMSALLKVGQVLQDFKKMKEAIPVFEKLLQNESNNTEAMLGLGISLTHLLGEADKKDILNTKELINKYFKQALQNSPENPDILLNFGIYLIEQGNDAKKGYEFLNKALALAPKDTNLLYNIGFIKFKNGHNEEALSILNEVLKVDPNHTDAMVHIGIIHQEKGDINTALQLYKNAVKINPKNTQNRNLLGMILQECGNLGEALEQFQLVLSQDKQDWSVHMNLATIYKQLNELEKSNYHREICIKLYPESMKMFEMADAENTPTDTHINNYKNVDEDSSYTNMSDDISDSNSDKNWDSEWA